MSKFFFATSFLFFIFFSPQFLKAQEEAPFSLSLTFAGDLMAHNVNFNMDDYSLIYTDIKDILQADDLSFTNMEFPIMDNRDQYSYPCFNIHSPYLEAAIDAGFDVFSLANNHSCDQGRLGVLSTLNVLNLLKIDYDIHFNGLIDRTSERYAPEVFQKKGISIAFFGLTALSNSPYGLNNINYIDYLRNLEEKRQLLSQIEEYDKIYDLVIIGIHDGIEYSNYPSDQKINFYRELVLSGVDILWSSHPHVMQPYEILSGPDGEKLIIYSNGNLISGQGTLINPQEPYNDWNKTCESVLFQVKLEKSMDQINIISVEPEYIFNVRNRDGDFIIVKIPEFMDNLLDQYSEPWRKYYNIRYEQFYNTLEAL